MMHTKTLINEFPLSATVFGGIYVERFTILLIFADRGPLASEDAFCYYVGTIADSFKLASEMLVMSFI